MDPDRQRLRQALRTAIITICINTALAFIKIVTGLVGHSYALIADGIESMTDIFTSIVVFNGFRIGARPADENHPYGHGKAESLAALFVSLLLTGSAGLIVFQSIKEIITPHHGPAAYTLFVLVAVIIIKELLFRFLMRKSQDLDSLALQADAWHSRSDALTSLAAFIGISVALLAGVGWESADDWAALFASGIILWNAFRILKTAVQELMDAAPGAEIEERIRLIAKQVEGVCDVEKCRLRKSGSGFFLDIHIEVNPEISVRQGHDIAHRVKDQLDHSDLPIIDAMVHTEPHSG